MLNPDTDARRMLVRERHAVLSLDALEAQRPESVVTESRIRSGRRGAFLRRIKLHLRLAGHPS